MNLMYLRTWVSVILDPKELYEFSATVNPVYLVYHMYLMYLTHLMYLVYLMYLNATKYVFHSWQTTFSSKDATNC